MGLLETVLHLCFYFPVGLLFLTGVCVVVFACNPLFFLPVALYTLYVLFVGYPSFAELELWASLRKRVKWNRFLPVPDYSSLFPVINADNLPSADTQALYTFHPHGLLSLTRAIHTVDPQSPLFPLFENAYHAIHGFFFHIPFLRELMLYGGCIPADRVYMDWAVERGASVTLTPGGAREVQYAQDKATREVWLFRNRKGYIRFAKRHGIPIIPLYTAGEQEVMTYPSGWVSSWLRWLSDKGRLLTGMTVDLNIAYAYSPSNLLKWLSAAGSSKPLTAVCVGQPVATDGDVPVEALQETLLQQLQAARAAAPAAFRKRRLSVH
jgi:hypothetical protein